jgi:hypothetical protein
MQIQVNIPEELNKKLKFYKLEKDLVNLQETVIEILNKFFEKSK